MPMPRWKKEEIDVLLNAEDKNNITLPNRSAGSIRKKLVRMKLIKPAFKLKQKFSKKRWTDEEIDLLKLSADPRNFIYQVSQNNIEKEAVGIKQYVSGVVDAINKPDIYREVWHSGYDRGYENYADSLKEKTYVDFKEKK